VSSKYSVYATNILQKDYNMTLIIAQAAAIISYLPVGMISSKFGRKKCILAGVLILGVAFGSAYFADPTTPALLMNLLFALAGIGWATINVNSFPMVVELARGGNVGKYTGYYYTASMAAQVLTPFLSGLLMDGIGMTTLFPYATIFVAGSLSQCCSSSTVTPSPLPSHPCWKTLISRINNHVVSLLVSHSCATAPPGYSAGTTS
jgi:MFS family permease